MRKFIIVFLSCIFLNLYCNILCEAEEKRELKAYPSPDDIQKTQQSSQQRPILPPVVPQMTPMISPTPSPHITAPQIPQQVMSPPPQPAVHQIPQPPTMQNIPSVPAYVAPPTGPVSIEIPQVPVIGNTIGKVTNLRSEKNGSSWIEVNDNLFGELVKVKIKNFKNTPIVKQAQICNFKDIKIGDTVNIMFHTEGDDNIANFINIMTEEEIEMMNNAPNSELTVTPAEKSKDSNNPIAPIKNNNQPQKR